MSDELHDQPRMTRRELRVRRGDILDRPLCAGVRTREPNKGARCRNHALANSEYCRAHDPGVRARRLARTEMARTSPGEYADRFWALVDQSGECWIWRGLTRGGGRDRGEAYGFFKFLGERVSAHRFAYLLAFGPIPDGQSVCHRCDVPLCVRPDHLFLGSHAENMADRNQKGRVAVGERNGKSKLTSESVRFIRRERERGRLQREIAADLGVSKAAVASVCSGRTWSWIT